MSQPSSQTKPVPAGPYRVMLVDDSAVIRGVYTKVFESDPELAVVASAGNGQLALQNLSRSDVDVIILDIEMPVMDGITALPKLLEIDPSVQILMSSTLTKRNAEISMAALQLGAKDYLTKPSSTSELASADDFKRELLNKAKALAARRRKIKGIDLPNARTIAKTKTFAAEKITKDKQPEKTTGFQTTFAASKEKGIILRKPGNFRPDVLAIGSSTGGPNALFAFFKTLPKDINVPVVITQHMPPNFTTILSEHIQKMTGWHCHEAKQGDVLEPNKILVAPGDYHMTIVEQDGKKVIHLNQEPQENYCRPSVDPMLRSLIKTYGPKICMVMLTGMGSDGLSGSRMVVDAGGSVIAQDEPTSVVWGMPGAVATAGLCCAVLPIDGIADYTARFLKGHK